MKFLKSLALILVAVAGSAALSACQPSDPSSPKVASLSSLAITPNPVSMDVGVVQPLIVTATYSDSSTRDVNFDSQFASSAPAVATVNAQGVVTGVAPGTTTVTATHVPSGKAATVTVTVRALRIVSIQVTPSSVNLAPGGSQSLTVTGTYNDGSTGNVTAASTFATSDEAVASIDASGRVTGVAVGNATITVTHTSSGESAEVEVDVSLAGPLHYASSYTQLDPTHWQSAEGGEAGTYIGDATIGYAWNGADAGGSPPQYYFGYGLADSPKPWGFGTYVRAPGNGTASVAGYSHLQIAVWGNNELMATGPTLTLLLIGPTISGCAARLESTVTVPAIGAQTYIVPLSSFVLATPCGFATAAEALAAGVNEVHVQVLGNNVQYVTLAGGFYPNGLNIGPIALWRF